jgi:hypothetical protein
LRPLLVWCLWWLGFDCGNGLFTCPMLCHLTSLLSL